MIGAVGGALIGGIMFLLASTAQGEVLPNDEALIASLGLLCMPLGAVLGLGFGALWVNIVSAFLGFVAGSIVGSLIVSTLTQVQPSWFPERQERAADKSEVEAYFAALQDLHLDASAPDALKRQARELTLSVLHTIHSGGKGEVLLFLKRGHGLNCEDFPAGFITRDRPIVDLTGANLRNLRLRSNTHLSDVDLSGTDLRDAKFISVLLNNSDLKGADLRQASLIRVTFNDADLREADLAGAVLGRSHLMGADFRGANLCGANFCETIGLGEADFRGALFDATTKWPEGFDPKIKGAIESNWEAFGLG